MVIKKNSYPMFLCFLGHFEINKDDTILINHCVMSKALAHFDILLRNYIAKPTALHGFVEIHKGRKQQIMRECFDVAKFPSALWIYNDMRIAICAPSAIHNWEAYPSLIIQVVRYYMQNC